MQNRELVGKTVRVMNKWGEPTAYTATVLAYDPRARMFVLQHGDGQSRLSRRVLDQSLKQGLLELC